MANPGTTKSGVFGDTNPPHQEEPGDKETSGEESGGDEKKLQSDSGQTRDPRPATHDQVDGDEGGQDSVDESPSDSEKTGDGRRATGDAEEDKEDEEQQGVLDSFVLDDPDAMPTGQKERFKRKQEQFRLGHWDEVRWRDLILIYPFRLSIQTYREMKSDKLFVRASSLAYFTALSIVPLLAVSTALIFGFGGGGSDLLATLQSYLLPMAGERVTQFLTNAINRATSAQLGPASALALIFTSVGLFIHIERVFNDMWNVENRRSIMFRVLIFYAIITSMPLLVSVSIYQAAAIDQESLGWLGQVVNFSLPTIVTAMLFFTMYKFLPNTKVKWQYALISAVVIALAFELAKWGFKLYFSVAFPKNYSVIYGALGLIPVFLIWVYTIWIMILFGSEMAYCMQNLRHLMLTDKVDRKLTESHDDDEFIGSTLIGLEVLAPVARCFAEGEVPVPMERVCGESGYSRKTVARVMARLKDAGVVAIAGTGQDEGYVPARPLERIPLLDVVAPFEEGEFKAEHTEAVRSVLVRSRKSWQRALRGQTAADLLDQ